MNLNPPELPDQPPSLHLRLILDCLDEALALFDQNQRLVWFNQPFVQFWSLHAFWLQTQPSYQELLDRAVAQKCLSEEQQAQLQPLFEWTSQPQTITWQQADDRCELHLLTRATADGGRLLIVRKLSQPQHSLAPHAKIEQLTFLLGLTTRLQASTDLYEIGRFALQYLVRATQAAFGDVKVIRGVGEYRYGRAIVNEISSEFIATYGEPVTQQIEAAMLQGIPYGQGLLWTVVETGQPLFVEDYAQHPQAVPAFRHPGIGQLGIFPIPSSRDSIIGILTLESRNLQGLQAAPQQEILQAACRTLGLAIERAQAQECLQQMNQDLVRSSQHKSEFLAAMSHELRTPLTSILGFSSLLLQRFQGPLTEKQQQYVSLIQESGQHLLDLINDILDLSKIEAGKEELTLQAVDIRELCSTCLKIIQPRAERKDLVLTLELDFRLHQVTLDERRVRQMLINLLSNAVKFTPEQGRVRLSGRLATGSELLEEKRPDQSPISFTVPYLCLEVTDSGIGIPVLKQPLLFQQFQQLDTSLSRQHEGTGLGLALTKRLAELHGGTVSFESVEGEGSTFRVWLPLLELRQASITAQASHLPLSTTGPHKATISQTQRMLIVEDQVYSQILLSEILEAQGYQVELLTDGQTMLELIQTEAASNDALPNLILMDIQLPGVDGLSLIAALKAHPRWQRVPVIAVTALTMTGDQERCLQAGADGYLSKPFDLQQTIAMIQALLAQS